MKRTLLVLGMVMALALSTMAGAVADGHGDDTGYATTAAEYDLLAGQDELAGKVYVWDVFGAVYVQYVAKHGWCILETHVDVAADETGIPQNRGGPIPGQFSQGETFDDCVTLAGHYVFEDAIATGGEVAVAAHAVVQKTTVIEEGGYFADTVVEAHQGVQVDGNAIPANRSNPVAALEQEYPYSPRDDIGFFSLGFKYEEGDTAEFAAAGGSIEVSFDCPVTAGEGPDLRIWEVTFGNYPEEKAEVFAWDGTDWLSLGIADNSEQGPQGSPEALTVSDFDLDSAGLMSTEKIKVVDITDPKLFDGTIGQRRANADGFDLDGIQALQDCTEVQTETAWADGDRFVDRGNWATYATYTQGDGSVEWIAQAGTGPMVNTTLIAFDLGAAGEPGDRGTVISTVGDSTVTIDLSCVNVFGDEARMSGKAVEAVGDRWAVGASFVVWVKDNATPSSESGSAVFDIGQVASGQDCYDSTFTGTGSVNEGNIAVFSATS